jgi:N utilization substance protein B
MRKAGIVGSRRLARECAMQILFQLDMNPAEDADPVLADFWRDHEADRQERRFAEQLVAGVREHREQIDAVMRDTADHWELKRIGGIERNVMRIALYEMLHRQDIPPVVSINEAVDIAKYFSTTESGRFVNGILDRVRKSLSRPARTADSDEGVATPAT